MLKMLLNPTYTLTGDSDWQPDDPIPPEPCPHIEKSTPRVLRAVLYFGGGMALVLGFQLLFGHHQAGSAVPPNSQPPIYGPVEVTLAKPAVPPLLRVPQPATSHHLGIETVELDTDAVRELAIAPHFPALDRFPSAIAKLHNHNGECFSVTSDHPAELVIEALVPGQPTPMSASGAVWVELATGEMVVLHLSQVAPDEVVLGETTDVLRFTRPEPGANESSQPAKGLVP